MFPWMNGLLAALLAALVASGLAGRGGVGQGAPVAVVVAPTETPTAVPTATPAAAPASENDAGAEFDAYMGQIGVPLRDLRDSFDSMSTLMQAPYVTDDGWRKDAAAAFDGIQAAHAALLQVEPPAYLAEAHAALTAGTEKCSQGAEVARKSIEEDSVVGLYAAAQLMKACGASVTEAGQMITQLQP